MRRFLLWLTAALVLVSVLPSLGGRLALELVLRDQGADRIGLDTLIINPWRGTLELGGLEVTHPRRPGMKLDHLRARLDLAALRERRLALTELRLRGLVLTLDLDSEQVLIGPLALPAPVEEGAKAPDSAMAGWQWGITGLAIRDINLSVRFDNRQHELGISELSLPELRQWQPADFSQLVLRARLNGSALAIDGRGRPLADTPDARLRLRISELDLGQLTASFFPGIEGILNSDLQLELHSEAGWELRHSGSFSLREAEIRRPQQPEVSLSQLSWQGEGSVALARDGAIRGSARGLVVIPALHYRDTEGQALRTGLEAELDLALERNSDSELSLDQQLDLTLTAPLLEAPQGALALTRLGWQGRSAIHLRESQVSRAEAEGDLQLDDLRLKQPEPALELAQKQLSASLKLSFSPPDPTTFTLSALQKGLSFNAEGVSAALASLAITGSGSLTGGDGIGFAGSVDASGVHVEQPTLTLDQEQLTAEGELAFQVEELVRYDGTLGLTGSRAILPRHRIDQQQFVWSGSLALPLENPRATDLSGSATLQSLNVSSRDGSAGLALKSLSVEDLALSEGTRLALGSTSLAGLELRNTPPLMSLANARATGVVVAPASFSAESVALSGLDAEIALDTDSRPRHWQQWLDKLIPAPEPTAQSPETAQATEETPPWRIHIASLELDPPARIRYRDALRAPDTPLKLEVEKLKIGAIDNRSSAPAPVILRGTLNDFGTLDLTANLSPAAPLANTDWKLRLEHLELPPLSPLMRELTGYEIEQGQLNLNSQGRLEEPKLEIDNRVRLYNFKVAPTDQDLVGAFNTRLGMPLELAVAILTDKDNDLKLNIPVRGSLEDPKFGMQSVINILLAKIAKQGAIGYLTNLLQPYGVLLTLGSLALDAAEAASVRLEPVRFEPGSAEMNEAQRPYLEKIARLLADRPGLRLKVCGHAVAEDSRFIRTLAEQAASLQGATVDAVLTPEAYQRWLINLAETRSRRVKADLLERDPSITPDRLYSCRPKPTPERDDPPGVSVGL